MLRNAEFTQPGCRLSQEGQVASFPIDHNTPSARGNATEPPHLTLACVALPPPEIGFAFLLDFAFIRPKSQYVNG